MIDGKSGIVFGPKKITKSMAMSDRFIQERLENETPSVSAHNVKDFVKELKNYEEKKIPPNIDYFGIDNLAKEAQEKLTVTTRSP